MKKLFLVILFLGVAINLGYAQDLVKFKGQGKAVVIDGDSLAASKIAHQSAVKKAISKAFESIVKKGGKDERNYHIKKSELLKNPQAFIKEENLISNQREGNLLTIDVEIAVDVNELYRTLSDEGIMASQHEDRRKDEFPDVMVLVVEEMNGVVNPFAYSSKLIQRELLKKDYNVIDETLAKKSIKHDQAVQGVLRGDYKAVQSVALQYEAGVVITGRAIAQKSAIEAEGMVSYGANVALDAIKADSGKVIATASAEGSYPHINSVTGSRKAIEQAAEKAIEKLLKSIEKDFQYATDSIIVTISNINFKQLAIIKKMFKRDFKQITKMKQKNFAGGVAKLEIEMQQGISDFAEEIALKDFKTFTLEVISFSPGKIDMALNLKQTP